MILFTGVLQATCIYYAINVNVAQAFQNGTSHRKRNAEVKHKANTERECGAVNPCQTVEDNGRSSF